MISKKELLEKYGISYGALYRWKRMGLIPEEWFLRRSTPTGQETFFRRKAICERMELILSQKESVSLEALAASLEEHRQTVRPRRRLVIRTAFSVQSYTLDELQDLCLVEDGRQESLLKYLKEVSL